jgi:hypothetical protein
LVGENALSIGYSPKSLYGVSNPLDDATLGAEVGANPSKNPTFKIYNGQLDGGDPPQTDVWVDIVYAVVFTGPINPTQS